MTVAAQLQSAAALHASGRLAEAAAIYRQVLATEPEQVDALRLLGLVFAAEGDLRQAVEHVQRAVAAQPDFAAGHSSLGLLLAEQGRVEEALAACRRAIQLNPNLAGAHCGLGLALQRKGDTEGAVASLRKAVALDPGAIMALSSLAPLLAVQGDLPGSIHCYRSLCQLLPGQAQPLLKLAEALRTVSFSRFDASLKSDLVKCFSAPGINYRDLAVATVSVLKLDPELQPLLESVKRSGKKLPPGFFSSGPAAALNDVLLGQLLQKSIVPDRELERLLTRLRSHMLSLAPLDDEQLLAALGPCRDFACSLAQQCFFNEYVYAQGDDEAAAVDRLETRLESVCLPLTGADRLRLAVYGCYRPLHGLAIAGGLSGPGLEQAEPLFRELLREQVANPLAERDIRAGIPSLVTRSDGITASVQAQYEENPFPRWKNCMARMPGEFASELRRVLPRVEVSPRLNRESPEILIAGCGTGQQAINCSRIYKNARITAIDLSLSSLAYARRMTTALGIDNIEYLHANILELDRLDKKFDLIECCGVLHHLSDPFRGWEILAGLLRKDAFLELGLYSELGRRAVVVGREFIAQRGYASTPQGIRNCRQELFETGDVLLREHIISAGAPFWTMSEVRDLVFHEHEHRYTIPEIQQAIAKLGLEFLGFDHLGEADKTRYVREFPADPQGLDLGNWHAYEQRYPLTFTNMYLFWLRN